MQMVHLEDLEHVEVLLEDDPGPRSIEKNE